MIRAAHGAGDVLEAKPLPRIYDTSGRGVYLRHGQYTPQIVTVKQARAARAKRKAQRDARRRNR